MEEKEEDGERRLERELLNFNNPHCPAFLWAREKVLEWHREQRDWSYRVHNCPKYGKTSKLPCTPYDDFVINLLLFFRRGGVVSPTAARGLLAELSDIPEDDLTRWIDHEVAPDPTARRLFFHAVGYTLHPFYYIVEGGVLQVDPGIRFSNPEAVIQIPSFMIEEVKKFAEKDSGES